MSNRVRHPLSREVPPLAFMKTRRIYLLVVGVVLAVMVTQVRRVDDVPGTQNMQGKHVAVDAEIRDNIVPSKSTATISSDSSTPAKDTTESKSSKLTAPTSFDLSNPVWPDRPPQVRSDCKVIFRNPDLQVCHIVPWGANFGDEIGPPIVKRILELYFGCSTDELATFNLAALGRELLDRTRNCLFSVGSLWRMVITGDHLWGTGCAYGGTIKQRCRYVSRYPTQQVHNLTIYSTRGPLTDHDVRKFCPFAQNMDGTFPTAGDAGFLIPYIFPEYAKSPLPGNEELSDLCVIPHHQERSHPVFSTAINKFKAKRLTVQQSWQNMTLALRNCKKVLSSSLHGIIFAESLAIPSRRMYLSQRPGHFKFQDFYESYRGTEPDHAENLTYALSSVSPPLSEAERDAYARRVLESFPIHLFQTVPADTVLSARAKKGSQHLD